MFARGPAKKRESQVTQYIRQNWLLIGILGCIFLAAIYPKFGSKKGPLKTDITVKYGAVFIIFLITGLSLEMEKFSQTLRHGKLHLFIQWFTFAFVPLYTFSCVKFLQMFNLNPWLLKGFITISCMPPPVSSAIILVRASTGNDAGAIFSSIVGSFVGIPLTPFLLLIFLGTTTVVPLIATIVNLTTTVLVPLILGLLMKIVTNYDGRARMVLNTIGQLALLLIIYSTFCDTFETPEFGLSALDILCTIFLVLLMQITLLGISFKMAQYFKGSFTRDDVVTIIFCSTHKSLTLGLPMLRIIFHGYSHLSQVALPLLVYHPTQIILGGLLVSYLKDWTQFGKLKKLPI